MILQKPHMPREFVGGPDVIPVELGDEFALGQRNASVEGGDTASVRARDQSNPRIVDTANHGQRVIRRPVVHNDDLDVP